MPVGWSPDGTRMAFMRPAGGRGIDLVVANHDGSDPHVVATRVAPAGFVVTVSGATGVAPAWSRDGQRLALSRVSFSSDIVLFKGCDANRLCRSVRATLRPLQEGIT